MARCGVRDKDLWPPRITMLHTARAMPRDRRIAFPPAPLPR